MVFLPAHIDCVKCFKNWIITGSQDCIIRIWDNETFQCLRILGKLNYNSSKMGISISETEFLELIEKNDEIFHFDGVINMDINDEYLVSGLMDGSCIIWNLPDSKPIDRLTSSLGNYLVSNGASYDDYIVCCGFGSIGVWTLSFDDLKHQLQFKFQYCIEE